MKTIYLLLIGFITFLVCIQFQYHSEFKHLQKLLSMRKGMGNRPLFTTHYKTIFKQQLLPLGIHLENIDNTKDSAWNDDANCIGQLSRLTESFSIQNENHFFIGDSAILYNLKLSSRKPIKLQIKLVKEGQFFVIDDIGHLDELVEYINLYNTLPEKEKRCQ